MRLSLKLLTVALCAVTTQRCDSCEFFDGAHDFRDENTFALVSGDLQAGVSGQALPQPIVVHAAFPGGDPIAGQEIIWKTAAGSGSVAESPGDGTYRQYVVSKDTIRSSRTAADGNATVQWRLGTTGPQRLAAIPMYINKNGEITLTATFSPTAMSVRPKNLTLGFGRQNALVADVTNGLSVTSVDWVSRDPSIVGVTANGSRAAIVNGARIGTAYIVANFTVATGTVRDSALVRVTTAQPSAVVTIEIDPANPTLAAGGQVQLRVRYLDAAGAETTPVPGSVTEFSVTSSPIATVGFTTGLLIARGNGKTNVQAIYRWTGATLSATTGLSVE